MTAIGIGVLWMYRDALRPAVATVAELPSPAARVTPTTAGATPMVLAVAGPTSRQVSALAAPLARARGAAVHILHVIETDVLAGEDTADLESPTHAQALLEACISELDEAGVPVTGELLHSYCTHADVAAQILHRATDLGAGAIVLGPETRHAAPASSVNAYIPARAPSHVIILNPAAGTLGRPNAYAPIGDSPVGSGLVRA
jgi:nucleotide-binding universal stress UspA family protein